MMMRHFSAVALFTSVSAVPYYESLKDFVGENAASEDVVTLGCNHDSFWVTNEDTGDVLLSYYSYYGWGTLICNSSCTDTALDTGGCWRTAVPSDEENKICVVAKQAGIQAGQRFAYQHLPWGQVEEPGCEENGVSGGATNDKYNFRIVPQAQIGDSSNIKLNTAVPSEGTGPSMTDGVLVIDHCHWSPRKTSTYDEGEFAEYDSANAYFELQCSVECNQSDVSGGSDAEDVGKGCPDDAVNVHMPFCVAASMLEIPQMTPFVINFGTGGDSDDVTKDLTGCTRNGITTESGSTDGQNWYTVVASKSGDDVDTAAMREPQFLVFLSMYAVFAHFGYGLA